MAACTAGLPLAHKSANLTAWKNRFECAKKSRWPAVRSNGGSPREKCASNRFRSPPPFRRAANRLSFSAASSFPTMKSDRNSDAVTSRFRPRDFADVLAQLPPGCPLVGGQAVAWWAERYGITRGHEPITRSVISRDPRSARRLKRGFIKGGEIGGVNRARIKARGPLFRGLFGQNGYDGMLDSAFGERAGHLRCIQESLQVAN